MDPNQVLLLKNVQLLHRWNFSLVVHFFLNFFCIIICVREQPLIPFGAFDSQVAVCLCYQHFNFHCSVSIKPNELYHSTVPFVKAAHHQWKQDASEVEVAHCSRHTHIYRACVCVCVCVLHIYRGALITVNGKHRCAQPSATQAHTLGGDWVGAHIGLKTKKERNTNKSKKNVILLLLLLYLMLFLSAKQYRKWRV